MLTPQSSETPCPTCQGSAGTESSATIGVQVSYVYALGRVEARFPTLAIEKEFAQAVGRAGTVGQTDQQAFYSALSHQENRYLARKLCWVFLIQGLETYLLMSRDPEDLGRLIEAIRPAPSPLDVDVVIGQRGPIAPASLCNGLMIPVVILDQLYSFDSQVLIQSIPMPESIKSQQFTPVADEIFQRIMQMTDNVGATDEHRVLNYLAMRYPAVYAIAAECYARELSLTAVEVLPSRLSGMRNIHDAIFSFTHRRTDVTEKYFVRVDVTEEFPFLVTKMAPYFDR